MRLMPLCLTVIAVAGLLSACGAPPSESAGTAPVAEQPVAPPPAPTPEKWPASPPLQVAVLVAPGTDSPFRWDPVTPGAPRTRVEDGVVWAPAADIVHAMKPGATAQVIDGRLQVDGLAVSVPTRVEGGDTWVLVPALALMLGGYAKTHPVNGSVALWPAETLQWLAANGDQRAPVLAEARAAGVIE